MILLTRILENSLSYSKISSARDITMIGNIIVVLLEVTKMKMILTRTVVIYEYFLK